MKSITKFTVMILFLLFGLFFSDTKAMAQSQIDVTIETGYDGTVKVGRAYPLTITLKNNGDDFSGELLLPFNVEYNLGGTKVIAIDVPANSVKSYETIIPAASYHFYGGSNPTISIYEGNRVDGKRVDVSGELSISPSILEQSESTLGVLSENPDRLQTLKLVNLNGQHPKKIDLSQENIPVDSKGLEYFDAIVVDDYPISSLQEDQQMAIIGWIKNGGSLIVGHSDKGHHAWGQLDSMIPLKVDGEKTINDLNFFITKDDMELPFDDLQVATGTVQDDAKVMVVSEDSPVVIQRDIEKGQIIQTAFSLGEEPLASWSDYGKWFETILYQATTTSNGGYHFANKYEEAYYTLGRVNELFSASQFSIGTIIMMMIGYLILIVPALYFILLKLDRREHAWWIIPLASIMMSLGIFGIGAKDRLANPVLAEMGMFRADESGQLSGIYTASLFSNTMGEYELSFPKEQFAGVPVVQSTGLFGDTQIGDTYVMDSILTENYHFPNMEYWAVRSVIGEVQNTGDGKFEVHLEIDGDQIKGSIENLYPYNFEELYIWSGSEIYELGKLEKGETIEVAEPLRQTLLIAPMDSGIQFRNTDELEDMKREELQNALVRDVYEKSAQSNLPIIFGYTKEKIVDADVVNKNEKNDRLAIIYSPFEVSGSISGDITLYNEQLTFEIMPETGRVYGDLNMYNHIELENGIYNIEVSLPAQIEMTKTEIEFIDIDIDRNPFINIEIFDYSINEYIMVSDQPMQDELKIDANRFFSSDGQMILRMEKMNPDMDPFMVFPNITVKGAVQ